MAGKRPRKLTKREKRKKDIRLIVQSNELVEARYMFDTWEMRFFHFFASMISKDDEEDKTYRIWLNELKKAYRLNNNDAYHQLREAAKRLSDKSVFLTYEKDNTIREVKHRFIKFIDYVKEGQAVLKNEGYVDVSIDKEMLPFLLHVQKNFDPANTRYTSYDFRNVIALKPYSVRIYQLLKKEEYRKERILTVEEIKRQFNIVDEYKRFSTLYQRIIEPSIININEHTDITVPLDKIEKLRKGRKIHALRIPIHSKTKAEIAYLRGEPTQGSLFDVQNMEIAAPEQKRTEADILYGAFEEVVVKDFGVTPSVFLKMITSGNYGEEDIEHAIAVTRRAKYNQEIKKSVPGFFIKALQQGFTDEQLEKQKKAAASEKQRQDLEALEKEYAERRTERIKQLLESTEGVQEKTILYLKASRNTMLEKRVKELGLSLGNVSIDDFRSDKVLRVFFIEGILHEYRDYFLDIDRWYEDGRAALMLGE